MSEGMPKWAQILLTGVLGAGGAAGGIQGLDLFGAEAKENERAAFISHINQCETNRTDSRTIALQMVQQEKADSAADIARCEADKKLLRELLR